ncbi:MULTISPECIES: PrsW family glutamic-type intramembrane protease [unclassified Haladaptatus]|uniref:PrsW family intramembrane metalloprotease n=1 Tax=unclassified Haladaptatus TaxID=2622732 RepID=UPI00209C55DC|nr:MULTISPECIES: PrsW family glutamic-type intramembrane protease [unclassified Haladaptatus]MCO8246962.1 PrsW family glutamic-type intramembrane protease [Haladaptatus sp. AB643]MCO8253510.1 PrsW family glutamic-type intramembrane protease [Haladaptatus sp. AB618]
MDEKRDPVARGMDDSVDLYGISTWEERTRLDWFATKVYGGLSIVARASVILLAAAILLLQVVFGGLAVVGNNPWVGVFIFLSVVPAFALAAYIWYADVTMSEPLPLLVGTFCLGVLFAMFAAVFNSRLKPLFTGIPLFGAVIYFYLIVGPVEETVKWLAVRLFAYRSDKFDAVIDGAVYGAMAGLGFATIENAIYISQGVLSSSDTNLVLSAGNIAVFRLFAGPGHVIYSAFAGYYLGLAKFNRENAGPIVIKGLLIAAFIHATYNTLVGFVPDLIAAFYPGITPGIGYIAFVFIYDGFFGYLLYRKISRYRAMYSQVENRGEMENDDGTRPVGFDSQSELRDVDGRVDSQREAETRTSTNGGTGSSLLGNDERDRPGNDAVYANREDESKNDGNENDGNENRDDETDEESGKSGFEF